MAVVSMLQDKKTGSSGIGRSWEHIWFSREKTGFKPSIDLWQLDEVVFRGSMS
jgi:hypothetical protein